MAQVSLHYMRGVDATAIHESNMVARYSFNIATSPTANISSTPIAESSIGVDRAPTPQPTADSPGHLGRQYTGDRPQITGADSDPQEDNDRIHDISIFWDGLNDTDGYQVMVDGKLQYTADGGTDTTYTNAFIAKGFQLPEGESIREVRFSVRGFKSGGPEGHTTQDGVFIPAHEKYYSPWSRDYQVLLREGGLGLNLGLAETNAKTEDSVDIEGLNVNRADEIMDAQGGVKSIFADVFGLEADSPALDGLMPLLALLIALALAAAIIIPMGMSSMSLMVGAGVFTLVWSVGGPLFLGVPIAMAVILPVLVMIGGVALIKTKGLA